MIDHQSHGQIHDVVGVGVDVVDVVGATGSVVRVGVVGAVGVTGTSSATTGTTGSVDPPCQWCRRAPSLATTLGAPLAVRWVTGV